MVHRSNMITALNTQLECSAVVLGR